MAIGMGLERRGAVYYWRKRLPDPLARRIGLAHIKMSLRTREDGPSEAICAADRGPLATLTIAVDAVGETLIATRLTDEAWALAESTRGTDPYFFNPLFERAVPEGAGDAVFAFQ
ncbi:DUF6538 domain-containing protein [Consotaella salsifontis]|uniref:DUF6538 domain-containing protein n=1 Tax=Consotaella salsifontis TaxID=1365950 RepID=A0A1T4P081_9HYPH|nr:DUF6538 domain-containing protein [Consotaella salsifontis]SJZ84829.1 hypothetical protein SAMN05428963_103269 [Consotaella salsifontis]